MASRITCNRPSQKASADELAPIRSQAPNAGEPHARLEDLRRCLRSRESYCWIRACKASLPTISTMLIGQAAGSLYAYRQNRQPPFAAAGSRRSALIHWR
jgi:hypothetical protein